jgi:hypothetical protein
MEMWEILTGIAETVLCITILIIAFITVDENKNRGGNQK